MMIGERPITSAKADDSQFTDAQMRASEHEAYSKPAHGQSRNQHLNANQDEQYNNNDH
jgi:hypothetical protein